MFQSGLQCVDNVGTRDQAPLRQLQALPLRALALLLCLAPMMPFAHALAQGNGPLGAETAVPLPDPVPSSAVPASTSFRPGHNLSLFLSGQQSSWKVERAGEVRDISFETWEPGAVLRYTYHLNIVRKFGLVLGTGVGSWYQNRAYSGFRPASSYMFPSIVVGFVQNFEADTRVLVCAEYAAVWYPGLTTRGAPDSSKPEGRKETRVELAPIPDSFSAFVQLDNFSGRYAALSVVGGWRVVSLSLLGKPSKNALIGSSSFRNSGVFGGMGLTWTLGDELGR